MPRFGQVTIRTKTEHAIAHISHSTGLIDMRVPDSKKYVFGDIFDR